ncbi:MAG: endolytic transglycosylase MltG [Caldilineaceae bacterium]|nr:endolytic transglycosylase MltG [Caldilineaceae bacterium]
MAFYLFFPFQRIVLSLLIFSLSLVAAGCRIGGAGMQQVYLQMNREKVQQAASTTPRPVRFVVAPGTPARLIGQQLETAGLITDAQLFEAYVRVNGLAAGLEAGAFILSPSMTLAEIAETLQHAQAASVTLTIPEGWRLGQIGDYVEKAGIFAQNPTELASYRTQTQRGLLTSLDPERYPFLQGRPAGTNLEGYLFPDTYELPLEGATAQDLLQRQLDTFAQRVFPIYEAAVAQQTTTLSLYEVLTVASIVEREAVVAAERPAIAGVYLNRLAIGMRLEADPTVQYAMGYQAATDQWWKTPVFLEEYSGVDSPYNTYLYPGLPPGPIANPGLSSIQAVLQPAQHDYFYFVALPDGTGAHVFARTFEEHSVNVQRYLRGGQ